jgi:MoaA/NifB/PqqE/SkfB family radical SAM enzyme
MKMHYVKNYIRAHSKNPREMILYVTNRCNAECKHCFLWQKTNKDFNEMTLEQLKKVSESFSLEYLSLTGGEPFLRNDLVQICEVFSEKTKNVYIPTNGYFTDRIYKFVKEISSNCKFQLNVQVSLDGLKETHNMIRNVDIFDNAVKTIKLVKDIVPTSVLTCVSNYNYKELEKLNEFVNSLGVPHNIIIIRGDPRDKKSSIPADKIDEVYRIMNKTLKNNSPKTMTDKFAVKMFDYFVEYTKSYLKGDGKKIVDCLAGRDIGVIYSNGDVSLCEMIKPFANLKDYDFNFKKLWASKAADDARERIKNCFCIHGCFIAPSMLYNPKMFSKVAAETIWSVMSEKIHSAL